MIITDKLVFIHYPKTGGIFVANALKKLHAALRDGKCEEFMAPNLKRKTPSRPLHIHGTWEQIPAAHRSKPVISCIRNPFDRIVSLYEFRNWTNWHLKHFPELPSKFPDFPKISFEDFISFFNEYDIKTRKESEMLKADIGHMTYSFIQFFSKKPGKIIAGLKNEALNPASRAEDMAEVTFMRTENLNKNLYDALHNLGYRKRDIDFILEENPSNVTEQRKKRAWKDYYTGKTYDIIRYKERLIFELFPEYDAPFSAISS